MRTELSALKSRTARLTGQLSLIALMAGLGAGCSMLPREPLFTGSTDNQRQVLSGQASAPAAMPAGYGAYTPAGGGGVQTADLPPPAGAAAPAYAPAPAAQAYAPPAQLAAAPAPVLGAPPTTLGEQAAKIGGGASGSSHLVQSGDTMYNIARRYGVSVDALIAANGGSSVARLGQRVVIPGGGSGSPASASSQLASLSPQSVPAPSPAAPMPAIPAAAAAPLGQSEPTAIAAPAAPAPAAQQVALAPQPTVAPAAAPAAPQPSATGPSGFRWPVRGRVITGFGKKADGERNDGINLAVPEGTEVKAAEDGTVIYAGNELKSYGNLVLIRHKDGWVSAYAHNSELKVKKGQQVKRGQVVSLSGMTGGVTTPQVHFELRKDATPVDPLKHLAES